MADASRTYVRGLGLTAASFLLAVLYAILALRGVDGGLSKLLKSQWLCDYGIKFLYEMAENGRFWQIYRRLGWFRRAGDRRQPLVSLFSTTFFETDELEVGR